MQTNNNQAPPIQIPSRTNKQRLELGLVFFLPGQYGLFKLIEERGREYIARFRNGQWEYAFAIELVSDKTILLDNEGTPLVYPFSDLKFQLADV